MNHRRRIDADLSRCESELADLRIALDHGNQAGARECGRRLSAHVTSLRRGLGRRLPLAEILDEYNKAGA